MLLLPAALWRGAGRHGGLSSPLRPLQGGRPAGGEDGGLDQGGALPPHLDCPEYGEQVGEVVFTLSSLYMETLVQVEARLHNWRDWDDGGHGDGRTESRLRSRLSEAGGEDCQWDDPGLDHRGENCEYLKLDFCELQIFNFRSTTSVCVTQTCVTTQTLLWAPCGSVPQLWYLSCSAGLCSQWEVCEKWNYWRSIVSINQIKRKSFIGLFLAQHFGFVWYFDIQNFERREKGKR